MRTSLVPFPPGWPDAARASGRNRPGGGRSSDTGRSRRGLSPQLAGFLQTDIRATDDGRRVMIPEMLQALFQRIILDGELADLALQLGDPAGIVERRQVALGATLPNRFGL